MPPASPAPPPLHRRYSVPEIIMRKYRLAQQSGDSDGRGVATSPSPSPAGACACADCGAGARERMRKSALLRRLWGPAPRSGGPASGPWGPAPRASRSLCGSSCELRRARSPACSECAPTRPASPAAAPRERDVFARYSELADAAAAGARAASPPPPARPPPPLADAAEPRRAPSAASPPFEVLEIAVSETRGAGSPAAPAPAARADVDEYVSGVLLESLQSLSAALAAGGAGRVLRQELRVRLQHAAVNTVVHLSPTSNHQIIFGNEELCRADDAAPPAARGPPPDGVDRAVLRQIQKLFRDELHRMEPAAAAARPARSPPPTPLPAPSPPAPAVGVGAGNYWARAEPALVPRPTAPPHSVSMEVHASSSDAEPSACPSLVDSLDDPASPRAPPPRLAAPPAPTPPPEAFFVRMADGGCERRDGAPAPRLPPALRERLLRRQRRREQRADSARRQRERARRRGAERDARAAAAALVDELVAEIARDEHASPRAPRRARAAPAPPGRRAAPRPPAEPRRVYQKSEIRDGDRCIEILEILEYATEARTSPETPPSDGRLAGARARRSRIPVPVPERAPRPGVPRSRTTEDFPPRSPPAASPPPGRRASLLAPASPPPGRRASLPAPASPRAQPEPPRARRVCDVIPEERAGVSPPPAPPPARATRSAATSPAPGPPARASRSTMTSPRAPPPVPAAGMALACAACR